MTDSPPPQRQGLSPALADALKLLEKAERTVAEMRGALLSRYEEAEVEAALAWLRERRMLSDERAAEATVRPRAAGRRAEGDARLRDRLERRGTAEDAIEAALAQAPDEAQRMHDALAAKFHPEDSQLARAGRFLLSRGFEEEAVHSALERFFGETGRE